MAADSSLARLYVTYKFTYLSASLPDLKQYLEVREQNEMYESVRRAGGIGIPYFELEDGTGTLDLNEVMARI